MICVDVTTLRVEIPSFSLAVAPICRYCYHFLQAIPLVLPHSAIGGTVVRASTGVLVFIVLYCSCGLP